MLCIFVICSEMPLMMKNKKAGIQILKNKFLDDSNKNEINSEMLDKALKNLRSLPQTVFFAPLLCLGYHIYIQLHNLPYHML